MVNVQIKKMALLQIVVAILAVALAYATSLVLAQLPNPWTITTSVPELGKFGAGLAIGLAGLGAGIGMGTAGAAAIGAITERPEVFGRTMIYIVFIEAIAIYGLVIAFMVMG